MKRILVIQTASIGDVILATPLLEALHERMPEYKLDILVKNGNESLFSDHPFISEILAWNKKNAKYRNLFRLIAKIRSRSYSYVINLQRFFSSGLITAFSGSKMTVGFSKNPLAVLFKYAIPHNIEKGLHESERNMRLLRPLGIDNIKPCIKLYPQPEDFKVVEKYKTKQYITISPASLWYTKQYPSGKWVEFLDSIPEDLNVFILGSANDEEIAERIKIETSHKELISLCGKLTFLESAALMKNAVMNYTNDSAPLHLCSAVDSPVAAVFCSTTADFGFGPVSSRSYLIESPEILKCRPCGIHGYRECPEKHFKCALNINKEQLLVHLER